VSSLLLSFLGGGACLILSFSSASKGRFLEYLKFHKYADDLQIYHTRPRDLLSECIQEVNSDLRKIFEWSHANLLRLNPSKSLVLSMYRGHLLGHLPPVFLVDDIIPNVYKANNNGVTFAQLNLLIQALSPNYESCLIMDMNSTN
jgi:hypothetical protein